MKYKNILPAVLLLAGLVIWIALSGDKPGATVTSGIAGAHCGTGGSHKGCAHARLFPADPAVLAQNEAATRKRLFTAPPLARDAVPLIASSGEMSPWKGQAGAGIRARRVSIAPAFLSGKPFHKGENVTLNLFDDVSLETVVYESFANVNGTVSTTARVAGTMFGRAVLAFTEKELRVKVILPESNQIFEVHYNHDDGHHYVLESDPAISEVHGCGTVAGSPFHNPPAAASDEPLESMEASTPPLVQSDEGVALVVIDTSVVYPDNVVSSAGSEANVKNIAAQGIALANDAHIATNTGMYINLVHTGRLSGYTDSGSQSTDLTRLTETSDGFIDTVHTWRNTYGADFVHMMHSVGGGLGWMPNFASTGPGQPQYGFSVTGWNSFASYTPAHEMGHNMNLDHSKFQEVNAGAPAAPTGTDAAGWHWHPNGNTATPGYCSVMSYTAYAGEAGHTRVGLFSDPNIVHSGQPAGDVTHANAARVLRLYKSIYAGYRTRPLTANSILVESPNGGEVLSRGQTVELRWNSNTVVGDIKLELYRNGVLERQITAGTINDRVYYYTIPNDLPSSNLYKLRVTSVNNTSIFDVSDANFTITQAIYAANLDTNPAFTISGAGGGWQYGVPAGDNPTYGGAGSAYTGSNIYDTNLTGASFGTHYLTTPAIDCSNFQGVTLKFAGWFSVTSGYQAKVEVSNNGSTWTQLYSVSDSQNSSWKQHVYDISAVADGQSAVYVRWAHVLGTGGSNYSGMSVDDVSVLGINASTQPVIAVNTSGLTAETLKGGSPANQTFTVKNMGSGTLNYAISSNQSWLTVSPAAGTSGGEEDTITVSFSTAALAAGNHSATLTVSDNAAGNSPVTIPVSLLVTLPPIYQASMDSNPGWTLDAGWAYGQPGGAGQDAHGNPDPAAGYNGPNVIGYNLSGDYEANISGTRWARTPAIDCRNRENVTLRFRRWLGVEGYFDNAYIEVSNNGSTWTRIWENSNTNGVNEDDNSWVAVQYDISAVADNQATVYIRWGMGSTDGEWNFCGWNIDEVVVNGDAMPSPYPGWATGLAMNVDSNGDGVANGVAWVLGAAGVSTNAASLLPTADNVTDANYFIFTYRRSDLAKTDTNTAIAVQYGSTLGNWTTAVHDGTNVIISEANDGYGTGVDKVTVKIKRTLAVGNKLFTRLRVNIAP